jgi:hypothetical protein
MKLHQFITALTAFIEKDVKVKITKRDNDGVATHFKLIDIGRVTPDFNDKNEIIIHLENDEINNTPWLPIS